MSGLTNPVVGTCSVPLAEKMPWNDAGYRPPQTQSFNAIKGFKSCDTEADDLSRDDVEARATPRTSTPSPDQKRRFSKPMFASETTVALFTESGSRAKMFCQERDVGEQREEEGTGAHMGSRTAVDCDPLTTGRPVNFGIGAVGPRQEGGGVGLDLPPIEEDAAFERTITRLGLERTSRGRGDGAGFESELRKEKHPSNIAAVECKPRFPGEPAWYERLVIGGGNALGIIDTEEEDRWNLEELDIDFPREWANSDFMEGRNWWLKRESGGSEVENFLKKSPFENYPLFLGAEKLKSGVRLFPQAYRRKVGLLKGLVVVSETLPDPNFSEFVDMTHLQVPQTYCCRLYVVKGLNLQPKDLNGLADPYLQLKVGKLTVDDGKDKENIKKETLNPEFFRSFEFRVTMPGESQLMLKLYDYDRFGVDDLIGQTIIDLEDRWFSRGWHELEREDPVAYERWEAQGAPYKPLEVRDLSVPSSRMPQGQVMMWLDILTLPEARRHPLTKLEPPAPLKFEVRVVCWRSEDVMASDDFTGLRDLYCRLWMEAEPKKKRETDTHWRCKNGKGSWNYRIKFDVELPLKSREHGRLVFQMWDRDVLSSNDIVAETSIDLYRWFLKAYREQQSIKPYMIIKNARKQKMHHGSLVPPGRSYSTAAAATGERSRRRAGSGYQNEGFTNDRDSGCRVKNDAPRRRNEGRMEGNGYDKSFQNRSSSDPCDEGREGEGVIEEGRVDGDPGDGDPLPSGEKNDSEGEERPLLGPSGAGRTLRTTQDTQNYRRARRVETDDTDDVVNAIKEWFGVGKAPEDATWLELTKRDPEAGTIGRMGKMLISLELLPKDAADAQPVGAGRNEPNQNPYLPPPTGRMKFSFNPIRLSKSLLGPKAFYKVLCCCICIVITVGIVMSGDLIIALESIF